METAAGNAAGGLHFPMRPQSQFQGHRSVPAVQHSSGSTEWSSPRDQVFVTAMRYHLHRSFECAYFYELCVSEGLLAGQYQSKPARSALRENDVQLRHGMTAPKFYSSPILRPPALQKRRTEIMDIDMQKLCRQKEKVCNGIPIADLCFHVGYKISSNFLKGGLVYLNYHCIIYITLSESLDRKAHLIWLLLFQCHICRYS